MRVTTFNDHEASINWPQPIVAEFRANIVRGGSDFSATPFKAKIANAELWWCRCWVGRGSGRAGSRGRSPHLRPHHGGPQGAKPKAEVVADILASIKERRA